MEILENLKMEVFGMNNSKFSFTDTYNMEAI